MGFIYCITNTITGKKYIGQTIQSVQERFKQHLRSKNSGALSKSILKHGKDKFVVETLFECDQEFLEEKEREFILLLGTLSPNGYNLLSGGKSCGEHHLSTKQKMREKALGRKRSEESIRKTAASCTGENHYRYGKSLPLDLKEKQRQSNLKRTYAIEFPDGRVEITKDLLTFSEIHGFNRMKLLHVASGKEKTHRGVKVKVIQITEQVT